LGDPKSFHYLNQSNCYELVGVNAAQEYLSTKRAMDIVGISQDEQVSLKHLLVFLIIHLAVFQTKLQCKISNIFPHFLLSGCYFQSCSWYSSSWEYHVFKIRRNGFRSSRRRGIQVSSTNDSRTSYVLRHFHCYPFQNLV